MQADRRAAQRGVTLIEIMIVLAIIGLVLGVLVGPKVMSGWQDAQRKTAQLMLEEYRGAFVRWMADTGGACPEKLGDLLRYTNKKDLKDPWGSPFAMRCGGEEEPFVVVSPGPDRVAGTTDDLRSPR
jgi:prepilin-type N-terminal cleavage/methylation domain-containing protein